MSRRPVLNRAQGSFFDTAPEPLPLHDFGMEVRSVLAETLAAARDGGADRHAVAAAMNRLAGDEGSGREMTKRMLDQYCAPSSTDWRFPLEALPLLHRATGDARLLTLVNSACGQKALPEEAAALGELMLLEMQKRELNERAEALRRRLPKGATEWASREIARRGRA
ncbi:hypothetical protein ACQW02_25360 [Humitalea sp. 24SJ18S-53]|uniref:hypothetical protein n=1 Tax=Humitalea sp. 24SJ18S-53 TaxID=3422307 RepID=UPI003D6706C7